ncbi:hypothetical protein VCRA2120E57_100064 [Vibrio crassostreae]|nr:hypothetical protein VCRA2120E57_100064 [Vibrio crassostreae]
MSIQEIAIKSGYSSDSAYVQAFKKLFNQTQKNTEQQTFSTYSDSLFYKPK